jgi:hypothetical protein
MKIKQAILATVIAVSMPVMASNDFVNIGKWMWGMNIHNNWVAATGNDKYGLFFNCKPVEETFTIRIVDFDEKNFVGDEQMLKYQVDANVVRSIKAYVEEHALYLTVKTIDRNLDALFDGTNIKFYLPSRKEYTTFSLMGFTKSFSNMRNGCKGTGFVKPTHKGFVKPDTGI